MTDHDLLRQVDVFRDLNEEDRQRLHPFFRVMTLREGDAVFREGDRGGSMFIIKAGTVKILKESVTGNKTLTSLGAKEIFGELSLFDRSPRSATAVATTPVDLMVLSAEDMGKAFESHPATGLRMLTEIIHQISLRLRATNDRLQDHILWGLTGRL